MKIWSAKERLTQTRASLKKTLNRILDINRKRKVLKHLKEEPKKDVHQSLEDELNVLNHVATNQAQLVKKYETRLALKKAM